MIHFSYPYVLNILLSVSLYPQCTITYSLSVISYLATQLILILMIKGVS